MARIPTVTVRGITSSPALPAAYAVTSVSSAATPIAPTRLPTTMVWLGGDDHFVDRELMMRLEQPVERVLGFGEDGCGHGKGSSSLATGLKGEQGTARC